MGIQTWIHLIEYLKERIRDQATIGGLKNATNLYWEMESVPKTNASDSKFQKVHLLKPVVMACSSAAHATQ